MRIGILSSPESWYFRDLLRAGNARGHELRNLRFHAIRSEIALSEGCGRTRFFADQADPEALIVRSMPPGTLEQVVFRMDALGEFESRGGYVLNPARSLETAIDKYLTTAKLSAAGLPTPPTCICQTAEDAHEAFSALGGDVVVKPLFGGEGRGITRVTDPQIAHRVFKTLTQLGAVLYLQQFVPHEGFDIRILVVGDQLFSMRRRGGNDWRTNISQGAVAEPYSPNEQQRAMARQAARLIGAPLCGVDVLPARDGRSYLLECNAVPGWKALAKALQVDVAGEVIQLLEAQTERHGQRC